MTHLLSTEERMCIYREDGLRQMCWNVNLRCRIQQDTQPYTSKLRSLFHNFKTNNLFLKFNETSLSIHTRSPALNHGWRNCPALELRMTTSLVQGLTYISLLTSRNSASAVVVDGLSKPTFALSAIIKHARIARPRPIM